MKKYFIWMCYLIAIFAFGYNHIAKADTSVCYNIPENLPPPVTSTSFCGDVFSGDISIPVADFSADHSMPLEPIRITQDYNNHKGHNGLDLGGECSGWAEGKEKIHNVFKGIVILSREHDPNNDDGWGSAVCTASRPNPDSEEIVTHCSHHIHKNSRFINACQEVNPGDLIGLEGNTGNSHGAHLHYTTRRWKNLEELRQAIGYAKTSQGGKLTKTKNFFGNNGYGAHNGSHLNGHLDPTGMLTHTFTDYVSENGNAPAYGWSLPYVLNMRNHGIEFGLFDGRFGAGELVTRREAARWLKIGRELSSESGNADFLDVPPSYSEYPYIEALANFPEYLPVIDPKRACEPNMFPSFCPDSNVNRAEALKMVIMTFYGEEYMELYFDDFWNGTLNSVLSLFHNFDDVSGMEWYASYVYFGLKKGLVAPNSSFNPDQPVRREEMAKWIMMGRDHVFGQYTSACLTTFCPSGQYCDPDTIQCTELPECVPSAYKTCEIGGGNPDIPQECDVVNCTPGEVKSQACGTNNTGTQWAECGNDCMWEPWGECEGGGTCSPGQTTSCGNCGTMTCNTYGQWGPCQNQGVCQPGQQQNQTCNNVGIQTQSCQSSCTWGSWGQCSAECTPGQVQQQSCTVNGQSGMQEKTCNSNGQWGNWSTCQSSCQDTYLASSSQACYGNPNSSGSPTICLNVQQNSGPNWQYRICKSGGSFSQNWSSELRDDNNVQLLDTYNGSAGSSCSPWRNINVSYINGYGAVNGAGLMGYIKSPSTCTYNECKYRTGYVTIRKECL
mgnify:CR=1 FL=1